MSEHLEIIEGSTAEKYAALLPQIQSVIEDEPDLIARMANMVAMLHETFHFLWTGFYRVENVNDNLNHKERTGTSGLSGISGESGESGVSTSAPTHLVLGPFQGPLACMRIRRGRGVCGTAWDKDETQVVPDVEKFPGHIVCSSASKSEIVVPVHNKSGEVIAVLDIDSAELNTFDDTDKQWLERIVALL